MCSLSCLCNRIKCCFTLTVTQWKAVETFVLMCTEKHINHVNLYLIIFQIEHFAIWFKENILD